jgi:hypothetical protein
MGEPGPLAAPMVAFRSSPVSRLQASGWEPVLVVVVASVDVVEKGTEVAVARVWPLDPHEAMAKTNAPIAPHLR